MNNRSRGAKEALETANQILLPLLRAAKRLTRVYEAYARRPLKTLLLYSSGDRRIHVITIDVPTGRPLVVAVYSSVQSSRPVSPAQVEKRLKRLARTTMRQLEGAQADIIYIYLSKTRLTRASYRLARKLGVFVATNADSARGLLAKFLAIRLRRLIDKTRGRIWGPVALLALTLYVLQKAFTSEEEIHGHNLFSELLEKALRKRLPK